MQELAEVETTRRDLSKYIIGKKILNTQIYLDKLVFNKKDYFIDIKAKHIDSSEVTHTFYRTPRHTPFRDVYDERPIDETIKHTF